MVAASRSGALLIWRGRSIMRSNPTAAFVRLNGQLRFKTPNSACHMPTLAWYSWYEASEAV